MTESSATAHLFVSYSSADQDRVLRIADALEGAGFSLWIDRLGIPGGLSYGPEISAAIKSGAAMLLMCSSAAFASRNVRQEIQLAWKHERPILPLLLEPVGIPEDLEYWLEGCQWIEILDRPADDWLAEIARALSRFDIRIDRAAPPAQVTRQLNVPTPLTALLGREDEVQVVAGLLGAHRLVTLTGPGGVGKTRLAIEIARTAAAAFPDGVDFVDMSTVAEAALTLPAIARSLGLGDVPDAQIAARLAAVIGEQRRLLVLDNMEQLLNAAAEIAELLMRCPNLAVLMTSRASFSVRGEHVVPVEPLRVPSAGASPDEIAALPAVQLFVERAAAAQPGYAVKDENAAAIGQICARLDGLPLAIELAAARAAHFSPPQLLARLDRRLASLGSGPRDMPSRQRTLRDAIAWSHDLLSPEEQALFQRLAVFPGGCTLEAAETVCDPDGAVDAVSGLSSLVDKSLLRRDQVGEARRYRMLETVREFALEQLAASGEEDALRERLAGWGLEVFGARYELARRHPESAHLAEVAAEYPNLREILAWLERSGRADDLLRLTASLIMYWYFFGLSREGRDWCHRALSLGQTASPVLRAHVLMQLGMHSHYLADDDVAVRALTESGELARELSDSALEAEASLLLGIVLEDRGDHDEAIAMCQRALELYEALNETWGRTTALYHLGIQRYALGDQEEALGMLTRAADVAREEGYLVIANWSLGWMALVQVGLGQLRSAARSTLDAIELSTHAAQEHHRPALLATAAVVAAEAGEHLAAATLFGATHRSQTYSGTPFGSPEDALFMDAERRVHNVLGDEAFATAFVRGQTLSPEDAINESRAVVAACLAGA